MTIIEPDQVWPINEPRATWLDDMTNYANYLRFVVFCWELMLFSLINQGYFNAQAQYYPKAGEAIPRNIDQWGE